MTIYIGERERERPPEDASRKDAFSLCWQWRFFPPSFLNAGLQFPCPHRFFQIHSAGLSPFVKCMLHDGQVPSQLFSFLLHIHPWWMSSKVRRSGDSLSFSLFLSLSIVYWYLKRHQTGHFLFILYSPPCWIFFLFFTYCRTGSNPSDFCSLLFVYVLRRISSLEIFLILFSLSCVVLIRLVLGGSFHIRRPGNLFFPSSGNLWDCRVYCTMRCVNSNHELLDNIIDSW